MLHILIIDDEPYVRDALKRVLEDGETSVACAATAEEGLRHLQEVAVDLVIVDLVLPETDAIGLVAEIHTRYPQIPQIAISGGGSLGLSHYQPEAVATQAYLAAARKAGASITLAKPFETKQLRASVRQLLAQRQVPASIGAGESAAR